MRRARGLEAVLTRQTERDFVLDRVQERRAEFNAGAKVDDVFHSAPNVRSAFNASASGQQMPAPQQPARTPTAPDLRCWAYREDSETWLFPQSVNLRYASAAPRRGAPSGKSVCQTKARRMTLRSAFAGPLVYTRNEGFRTADLSFPFKGLGS